MINIDQRRLVLVCLQMEIAHETCAAIEGHSITDGPHKKSLLLAGESFSNSKNQFDIPPSPHHILPHKWKLSIENSKFQILKSNPPLPLSYYL